jgi:DnaJ-class molecular chaperone
MLPINDNTLNLAKYKGRIHRCPHCNFSNQSRTDALKMEMLTLGKACATCMGRGFVADCLNCEATGMYKGSAAAFGGGDHMHASTCNYCGGTGMFAVNQPENWKDEPPVAAQEVLASTTAAV